MAYEAPHLSSPVVLATGYAAPALADAIVLNTGGGGSHDHYQPPAFIAPIQLESDYAPPSLIEPVVLCIEEFDGVSGILIAQLAAPSIPLTFAAAGVRGVPASIGASLDPTAPSLTLTATGDRVITLTAAPSLPPPSIALDFTASEMPPRVGETLWAKLPTARPNAPSLEAAGDRIHRVVGAAELSTPDLPLTFRGRESVHDVVGALALPPPVLALQLTAIGDRIHDPRMEASLGLPPLPITIAVIATQDLDLPDADGPGLPMLHEHGTATRSALAIPQQHGTAAHTPMRSWAEAAKQIVLPARMVAAQMRALRRPVTAPHTEGLPISANVATNHTETLRTERPTTWRHQHGIRLRAGADAPHDETGKVRNSRSVEHQHGIERATPLAEGSHRAARRAVSRLHVRWAQGQHPLPGRWWPFYETPSPLDPVVLSAPYTPRPLTCPVVLGPTIVVQPPCPGVDPEQPGVVPVLECYIVINTFSLVRASDDAAVDAAEFHASLDRDSWCWSWSARIPASALQLIEPAEPGAPREFIATLNGTPLRLLAESIRRDRRHASSWLTVSGRGRAAWLAEPYAPVEDRHNIELRTAQQLINDALTVNGVPIGWSVDWNLDDWNVPAGAFSHHGSYIEAALRVAEAGGGYIQGHDTDETLIVLPHYPAAPWDWDAEDPDITLPEDACEIEGIEWNEKAPYNALWVVGGEAGRKDLIKRGGTAADRPAPTIVDPLATSTTMTRQRGLAVLADTGRQAHISLRLPLLPETGIIKPGLLLDYTENGTTRRGLTRAVSVDHSYPEIWQTVRIETHDQPV